MADDRNALTTRTDLARAQEIVRSNAQTGDEVTLGATGGCPTAGGGPKSAELRVLDQRIAQIMQLAHTGRTKDEASYEELQPELRELIAEKNALIRGGGKSSAPVRTKSPTIATAKASDGVPSQWADYPSLPDDPNRPAELQAEDSHLWLRALPRLHRAGITLEQSKALIEIVRLSDADAAEYRAEHRQQRHQDAERELRRRYGANFHADVARANRFAREVLPGGDSRRLCAMELADGSILGDHPLFVRLMIGFGKETQ